MNAKRFGWPASGLTFGVAATLLLGGCSAFPTKRDNMGPGTMQGARTMLLDKCKIATEDEVKAFDVAAAGVGAESGLLAGLVSSLAPSIVEKLVDFVAAYAEKRGREYSSTSTAAGAISLPATNRKGCLVYVAGAFGDTQTAEGVWTVETLKSLGLSRRPDVYVEWMLHTRDAEGKNFTITPVYLSFQAPQSVRTSGAGVKNLSFVVELSAPSSSPAAGISQAGPPPAAPAAGGGVEAGKPKPIPAAAAVGSAVAAFPVSFGTIPVGSQFRATALTGLTSPMQAVDKGSRYMNVMVTAVETEDGGDFLLTFAEFVTKNKSKITDNLAPRLQKAVGGAAAAPE